MTHKTVLFMGSQGSGKGTQARLLVEYLESQGPDVPVFYFGTGGAFRTFAATSGYTAKRVANSLEGGAIQPVFLPIWLWTEQFVERLTGNEHMVLDGSPRTLEEARVLESALRFYNRSNPTVIYLDVSEETAIQRITERGRDDDTRDAIEKRLSMFREQTVPALKYLEDTPYYSVVHIDADQTLEQVHQDIREKLNKIAPEVGSS